MSTRIFSVSFFCTALAALPATAAVRSEIAQDLQDAHRFAQSRAAPPNTFAAVKKIKAAEALPNQTAEEKRAIARTKAFVTAAHSNDWDCNMCRMDANGGDGWGSQ